MTRCTAWDGIIGDAEGTMLWGEGRGVESAGGRPALPGSYSTVQKSS